MPSTIAVPPTTIAFSVLAGLLLLVLTVVIAVLVQRKCSKSSKCQVPGKAWLTLLHPCIKCHVISTPSSLSLMCTVNKENIHALLYLLQYILGQVAWWFWVLQAHNKCTCHFTVYFPISFYCSYLHTILSAISIIIILHVNTRRIYVWYVHADLLSMSLWHYKF